MTKFRPCIDLHDGRVKQIVGSSLSDSGTGLKTNFETDRSPAWFAELYKKDGIKGGHVIMLGKGNVEAAKAALAAYPGGLQVGGGITADNAREYLDAGASHVIVTSWIFPDGKLDREEFFNAIKAILPAILYFTGIFIAVHLEAKKYGLTGIPTEKLPKFGKLIRKIYLLTPLVLLVIWVSKNMMTMQRAAAFSIVAAIAVGIIDGILDGTIPKERQNYYLNIVTVEVKRLSRLVTSMLALSRIDSGELKKRAKNAL